MTHTNHQHIKAAAALLASISLASCSLLEKKEINFKCWDKAGEENTTSYRYDRKKQEMMIIGIGKRVVNETFKASESEGQIKWVMEVGDEVIPATMSNSYDPETKRLEQLMEVGRDGKAAFTQKCRDIE
jgi:hypothetical protein